MATFTGLAPTGAVNIPLPAAVTAAKLPIIACWMSGPDAPNVWIPADPWDGTDPLCAVVVLPSGSVEIALRQGFAGWSYFVVAIWPN
jgi:hypothetical protein